MTQSDKKVLIFFCDAYDELNELCTSHLSDYKINQISRILRQFLFDDKSVISAAARLAMPKRRRGKFVFKCNPYKPMLAPGLDFGSIQDGFYPGPNISFGSPIVVSRQDLGKQLLFVYKGNTYNLRQLVKYIANKEGAVHFDQTELDVTELEMREIQDFFSIGERAALTSMLKGVAHVVLEGLTDLRKNAEHTLKQ